MALGSIYAVDQRREHAAFGMSALAVALRDEAIAPLSVVDEPRIEARQVAAGLRAVEATAYDALVQEDRVDLEARRRLRSWRDGLEEAMRESDERAGRQRIVTDLQVMEPVIKAKPGRRLIMGSGTLSDPDSKTKWLDRSILSAVNPQERPFAASDYARAYLTSCRERQGYARGMRDARAIPFRRHQAAYFNVGSPSLFRGRVEDTDLAYVDICSAYHQIYSDLSLDVEYQREKGLVLNGRCRFLDPIELGADKAVRNTLIGLTHPMRLHIWRDGTTTQVRCRNEWYAPQLWALIQDTLHCAMADVLSVLGHSVHYVNVDGLICDLDVAHDVIAYLRLRWGLVARIDAAGRGSVFGPGSYRIENGDGTTKGVGRSRREFRRLTRVFRFPDHRFERIREARLLAIDDHQHDPWAEFKAHYEQDTQ